MKVGFLQLKIFKYLFIESGCLALYFFSVYSDSHGLKLLVRLNIQVLEQHINTVFVVSFFSDFLITTYDAIAKSFKGCNNP